MITNTYRDLCDEMAGRILVTLFTPVDLSSGIMKKIKSQTESLTGKEVILSLEKDSSLIGGVLIKIGNVVYDSSHKAQIAKLKHDPYKE